MAQATGRVSVKVDGEILRSKKGAKIKIGGVKRTAVPNDQGTVDYMEETEAGSVKCTLIHVADTDLVALRNFAGGTVIYRTDSGRTYTLPNAFTVDVGELSDGEVEIEFGGDPAIQS